MRAALPTVLAVLLLFFSPPGLAAGPLQPSHQARSVSAHAGSSNMSRTAPCSRGQSDRATAPDFAPFESDVQAQASCDFASAYARAGQRSSIGERCLVAACGSEATAQESGGTFSNADASSDFWVRFRVDSLETYGFLFAVTCRASGHGNLGEAWVVLTHPGGGVDSLHTWAGPGGTSCCGARRTMRRTGRLPPGTYTLEIRTDASGGFIGAWADAEARFEITPAVAVSTTQWGAFKALYRRWEPGR